MLASPIKSAFKTLRARVRASSTLQRVIGSTGWLFAEKILRYGLGVVVWVWLARYLGPAEFGTYNYAFAFVGLFGVLATLGLDGIVVRDIVRQPSSRNEILGTAFLLKLVGGLLALFLAVVFVTLLRPEDVIVPWLVAILAAGLLFQPFSVIDLWFQSQIALKYSVYARSTAFVVLVVVIMVLIAYRAPLIAFAWAHFGEACLLAVGLIIVYRAKGYRLTDWRAMTIRSKVLLKDSWPLILSGLSIMIYMRIDQIMIGEMIGSDAVGIYSAATRISEASYVVPMVIVSAVFPVIVRSREESEQLYLQRFQRLYDLMIWLAVSITIPTTLLAGPLIHLLYGSEYSAGATVLVIHVWAAVFVFLGVASGRWYLAENMSHVLFQRTLIGGITNVVLNSFLIPVYGINGAAIATLISQAWAAYLHDITNPLTRRVFYMKSRALLFLSTVKRGANG
jgi:PST family polysaccharide transporter